MFRICHFKNYIIFKDKQVARVARVVDVQNLSFFKIYIIFKDK